MSLLGVDVGTTGCKVVAFNLDGEVIASSYREYPLLHPSPGWSELDPTRVWEDIKRCITHVADRTTYDPVTAMSISCQGEAVIPVDRNGQPLYNAIVTFDERTLGIAEEWGKNLGVARLFEITGMPQHPMYSLYKILWHKRYHPDIYNQARYFLCFHDFIVAKLGAPPFIDHSLAARTMMFDVRKKSWSAEILSAVGLDEMRLARAVPAGQPIGHLGPQIADELGLPRNVTVVSGGHDQPCGTLGAGIVAGGMAMNAIGTSDVIAPLLDDAMLGSDMLESNYPCYPHVTPDKYITIAFNLTGGLLLRWYRDVLGQEEMREELGERKDPYRLIIQRAAQSGPTKVFILPHFVGAGTPYMDPSARGAIIGLTIETDRPVLARSVLESTCYEARINLERLQGNGIQIGELRAIGGGAKSEFWLQMRADVFGKRVSSLHVAEAACLGAAILAGCGAGVFASPAEAVNQVVRVKRTYEPSDTMHQRYNELYSLYEKIYGVLKELNHQIAESRPNQCS